MTRYLKLAGATAAAAILAACATADTNDRMADNDMDDGRVLSDAQRVGVTDNDRFETRGGEGMDSLDDKFKIGCDDDDRFEARGCDDVDRDGDGYDRDVYDTMDRPALPTQTVLQLITASPDHQRLARAIQAADLGDDLGAMNGFTIFAPTDAAFADAALKGLSDDQDLEMLLKNHIVPGRVFALDVVRMIPAAGNLSVPTAGNLPINVYRSGEGFKLMTADRYLMPVLMADMVGTDGVIHSIGTVLVPDYDDPDIADN